MTKSRSRLAALAFALVAAGCASSGAPATRIAEPGIATGYLPLHGRAHLGIDSVDGAAMVIAPGIAVTNAHNANIVDPASVIGTAHDYDLMFYRTVRGAPPPTAPVVVGAVVTAYGQGAEGSLRIAHGVVREIKACDGCAAPAWFTFSNDRKSDDDAGPGFSGGPVLDASGRLVGITFGYKDSQSRRVMYAYDIARVREELSAFPKARN